MTPLVGGRVYGWLRVAALKYAEGKIQGVQEQPTPEDPSELANGTVGFCWMIAPMALSEESCEKIQRYALQSCSYYDAATQAPCALLVNGQIADAALRDDGPGVDELVIASLQFSISPFFLKGLLAAAPKK